MSTNTIATIELEELRTRIEQGAVAVVEALGPAYFAAGHLPGARNLPLDGLAARAASVLPDRDRDVVVYCASETCRNSHVAAAKLAELGYARVRVFAGGKASWQAAGLPLEAGPDRS